MNEMLTIIVVSVFVTVALTFICYATFYDDLYDKISELDDKINNSDTNYNFKIIDQYSKELIFNDNKCTDHDLISYWHDLVEIVYTDKNGAVQHKRARLMPDVCNHEVIYQLEVQGKCIATIRASDILSIVRVDIKVDKNDNDA